MILELKNIEKSFGDKKVLKGVSLRAESGKAFGMLGRNGAGKTTSIRIMMDVFPADSGEVLFDGRPIDYDKVGFGYLPEERGLYPKKKIIEQLVYFAELKGMKKSDAVKEIDYWLDRLDMKKYRNKRLDTLSKGNQQKIQLITALAHNPEMRFVFSNTTEAGISYHAGDKFDDAPAVSYPAKLTRLLFERFSHFNGALDKGWIIIPCELIDYNGDVLRELVLRYAQEWALPEAFIQWLDQANSFCSTLVDRIVTGYPRDEVAKLEEELGYHDGFLDTAEHFYLFVIQGPKSLATELRLDKYPLNVLIVDDIKPYKERKVAILNGAHTALVPVAFQAGLDTVGEAMNDAEICAFVEKAIYEEIIPVLDLPRDELESFASAVTGRFRNPYIKHQLLSIALNGMTKFRTRILPQLLAGQKANGTLPARLTFALAALIAFYRGERNGETYPVQDDAHWLERYQHLWSQHRDRVIGTQELVAIVLAEKDHWEQDLTQVPGLVEQVANDLDAILEKGMREAVRPLC